MLAAGEIVGDYIGELTVKREAPGRYTVTGPRGLARVVALDGRAWVVIRILEGDRKTPATDAHGFPLQPFRCRRTKQQAIDDLTDVLLTYKPRRRRRC